MVWTTQGRSLSAWRFTSRSRSVWWHDPKFFPTTFPKKSRLFSRWRTEELKSKACKESPAVESEVRHFQCISRLSVGKVNGFAELFILDTLDLIHLHLGPLCGVCGACFVSAWVLLWVLRLPLAGQQHACEGNWELQIVWPHVCLFGFLCAEGQTPPLPRDSWDGLLLPPATFSAGDGK